jgi:hypothetical protein
LSSVATQPATSSFSKSVETTIASTLPPTDTGLQASSNDHKDGLSRADKIAIGCGVSIPTLGLILAYLTYREAVKARRKQEQKNERR